MRLHRLELEGFGPFRERQTVDFDAFADHGIFLIAGRTGSGKSSVLDGVCFALYGGAPRYDGVEKRLRSDHCTPDEPTQVVVEFSSGGRRWRVTRSPEYERPKQRGTGMTTEPHRAQLEEHVTGEWIGVAARPVDVARELEEILGLSQQQFLQVILLAQNRFAEFLLAKNDERQKLLRRLFGTRTYEDYQTALEQRRRDAERALAAAGDGVSLLLSEAERLIDADELGGTDAAADAVGTDGADAASVTDDADFATRLEGAERAILRADYRAETLVRERDEADAAHRAADTAHAAAKSLAEMLQRRERSRAALAALEGEASRVAGERDELVQALAAEALRAPIETSQRAAAAATRAAAAVDDARAAWAATEHGSDAASGGAADASELRALIAQLTGDLAVWATAERTERLLADAETALAADRERATAQEALIAELDAGRAQIPGRLAALEVELADAREAAGTLDTFTAQLETAAARLTAARDAESLAAELHRAETAYLAASTEHDRARAVVTDLLQRRLAGHAGELAAALVSGEPCTVCGATEHPHPAPPVDDPVTDGAITAAERAREVAATAEAAASATARDTRESHAALAARAGGETVDALQTAHETAAKAVTTATDAAARRDRLTAERQQLADAEATVAAEREALATDLASLRESIAGADAALSAQRSAVADARGDFDSVAARIADSSARRDLAQRLVDALDSSASAAAVAATAQGDRDARIAASDFADVAAATAALREAASRAALDERIREYDAALRAERDRLRDLELDLAGVDDQSIDTTATAAALATARERWSATVDAAAHAGQTASRLRDLVERARRAHADIAGLADEHAVVSRLANTVAGKAPNTHRMTLESFVLAAELEEIVAAANLRLDDMSSGRFLLQHTDARAARGAASGLGLEIMDAHTGQARPAQSLSGGETFLTSLALALGLAEVVTARAGGVQLDTLFIDEGFGSLDAETLDLAMRTLDELRQGGRTVGLISHVPAMKEQLHAQLIVEAAPHGPSVIRQDAFAVPGALTPPGA